jgi:hypothetical protein
MIELIRREKFVYRNDSIFFLNFSNYFLPVKFLGFEVCIILFVALLGSAVNSDSDRIVADGVGYYDYLPSLFIHEDLVRKEQVIPERINSTIVYAPYGTSKVNKYHCGTALFLLPFFLATLALFGNGTGHTGYEAPFQNMVLIAALFYMLVALLLFRKLLLTYNVKPGIIRISQVALILATNVYYYLTVESSFSHVYSLLAVLAVALQFRLYVLTHKRIHFLWMCVLLGLVFVTRPINILVVLFFPFLAGSGYEFARTIKRVFSDRLWLFAGIAVGLIFIFVQCLLWYAQTGDFFVYSYGDEGFNFSDAHFWGILFSFRKGLFIYTPVLLLMFGGLASFVARREYFTFWTFLVPFILLTYVLSSWHDWVYGHSFGLRAFIEFFPLFLIPIALLLQQHIAFRYVALPLIVLATVLNVFQSWQYQRYILHWYTMDFEKYCRVFLKTSDPYKGLLWKEELSPSNDGAITYYVGDRSAGPHVVDTLYSGQVEKDISTVRISLSNVFDINNQSQIEVNIMDSTGRNVQFTRSVYLAHFAENGFNEMQQGHYWYNLGGTKVNPKDQLLIRLFNAETPTTLSAVRVSVYKEQE